MKKKLIKIFNIILIINIVIGVFFLNCNKSYAETKLIDDLSVYKPEIISTDVSFLGKVEILHGVLCVVGVLVAVCTLSLIGMKFILGSAEGKAQYKETLVPWLIGAIIVSLSIVIIPNTIYKLSNTNLTIRR